MEPGINTDTSFHFSLNFQLTLLLGNGDNISGLHQKVFYFVRSITLPFSFIWQNSFIAVVHNSFGMSERRNHDQNGSFILRNQFECFLQL